jgi:hypothetical protein
VQKQKQKHRQEETAKMSETGTHEDGQRKRVHAHQSKMIKIVKMQTWKRWFPENRNQAMNANLKKNNNKYICEQKKNEKRKKRRLMQRTKARKSGKAKTYTHKSIQFINSHDLKRHSGSIKI